MYRYDRPLIYQETISSDIENNLWDIENNLKSMISFLQMNKNELWEIELWEIGKKKQNCECQLNCHCVRVWTDSNCETRVWEILQEETPY